ncbi:MAG: putative nucleotidyltransferase [Flavobacteriales bacterium]
MENKTINIAVVAEIAEALQHFKDTVVFVGGAIVSLYTDDPAADEIRPTQDVDMTLNVINLGEWRIIQEELSELGFHPDPFGHAICSYKYNDIPVDIMAAEDGPLGPANKWFKIGFNNLWTVMAADQEIRILDAPCYLATKFEAFKDRGKDYRTSHDIEDIIYIMDNRTTIVEEVNESKDSIKAFIKDQLLKIVNLGVMEEVLASHIHPFMIEGRLPIVEKKINLILAQ